ncbi:MAG: O-antigen ligase family protein [Oscillospiraceae bacterium]|nr:O-antigen ligase family protein [Oscillospiraceae bacterium]
MKLQWNGKTPRDILRISSPGEFFDWLPQSFIDAPALFALAAFCLFPVPLAVHALFRKSFDLIVIHNMEILDYFVFPCAMVVAVLVYVFTLGKLWRAKRSPLKELEKHPTFVLFLFLMAWMSVGMMAVHGKTREVFYGVGLNHETFYLQLEYFAGFFVLGVALGNERWKLWLLRGATAVSVFLVPCAFYLWKNLSATPIFYDWRPSVACIWTNINYYGYFLTVFVSLSAALFAGAESWGWRVFYGVALAANTVALCYNDTLGAWIGAFCGCVFVVVVYRLRDGHWNRWAFVALGLFLLSIVAAGIANGKLVPNLTRLFRDIGLILTQAQSEKAKSAGSGRWRIWLRCMEIIGRHPLFGVGFEGIMSENLLDFTGNARPHNEYMQYALFYGVPAAILYTLGCLGVYIRGWHLRARLDNATLAALCAAFGYLCGAFFGLTVYNTAPYLFIMLGLGYVRAGELFPVEKCPCGAT